MGIIFSAKPQTITFEVQLYTLDAERKYSTNALCHDVTLSVEEIGLAGTLETIRTVFGLRRGTVMRLDRAVLDKKTNQIKYYVINNYNDPAKELVENAYIILFLRAMEIAPDDPQADLYKPASTGRASENEISSDITPVKNIPSPERKKQAATTAKAPQHKPRYAEKGAAVAAANLIDTIVDGYKNVDDPQIASGGRITNDNADVVMPQQSPQQPNTTTSGRAANTPTTSSSAIPQETP